MVTYWGYHWIFASSSFAWMIFCVLGVISVYIGAPCEFLTRHVPSYVNKVLPAIAIRQNALGLDLRQVGLQRGESQHVVLELGLQPEMNLMGPWKRYTAQYKLYEHTS